VAWKAIRISRADLLIYYHYKGMDPDEIHDVPVKDLKIDPGGALKPTPCVPVPLRPLRYPEKLQRSVSVQAPPGAAGGASEKTVPLRLEPP